MRETLMNSFLRKWAVSGGEGVNLGGSRLKVRKELLESIYRSGGGARNRKMMAVGVIRLIGSQPGCY